MINSNEDKISNEKEKKDDCDNGGGEEEKNNVDKENQNINSEIIDKLNNEKISINNSQLSKHEDDQKNDNVSFENHINNIVIKNKTFYYVNTTTNYSGNKYYASVGISKNFSDFKEFSFIKPKENLTNFSYIEMLKKEQENNKDYKGSYISLIQNENDEAIMSFGETDPQFDKGDSYKCQSENGYYFSCQVSSIKIGVNEIYTSSTSKQEIGLFSLTDEYLILPSKPGNETIFYYKNKINELFGIECIGKEEKNKMINLTCDYFNYEDLPDLYFEMKGGIGVMALSVDMFKILTNYRLEFKLKYIKSEEDSLINKWILGEPVTKNYNFFANYTDEEKTYLIIVPSSLNGFILILIATIGGIVFLFIFLIIIYCSAKKENKMKNNYFEDKRYNSKTTLFSGDKNYINEPIEENDNDNDNNEIEENEKDNNDKNEIIKEDKIQNDLKYENNEMKNLKINDIQNDILKNNNKNKKNLNEKDINNNGKMKNNNNVIELISNNDEDLYEENDSFI